MNIHVELESLYEYHTMGVKSFYNLDCHFVLLMIPEINITSLQTKSSI